MGKTDKFASTTLHAKLESKALLGEDSFRLIVATIIILYHLLVNKIASRYKPMINLMYRSSGREDHSCFPLPNVRVDKTKLGTGKRMSLFHAVQ
jgi:hypothetical protein